MGLESEWQITSYGDSVTRAEKWELGCITGHHVIPDHCFMGVAGVRGGGAAFSVPGAERYSTVAAPVVLLTADVFGSALNFMHSEVHRVFDPIEEAVVASGKQTWLYQEARDAGIESILTVQSNFAIDDPWTREALEECLDAYFITECGLEYATRLRAGTKPVLELHKPRGGMRSASKLKAESPIKKKYGAKFSPYGKKVG